MYFYILATKNYKLNLKSNLQLHQKYEICRNKVNQYVENVYTKNYKTLLREIKQLSQNWLITSMQSQNSLTLFLQVWFWSHIEIQRS